MGCSVMEMTVQIWLCFHYGKCVRTTSASSPLVPTSPEVVAFLNNILICADKNLLEEVHVEWSSAPGVSKPWPSILFKDQIGPPYYLVLGRGWVQSTAAS